MIGRYDGIPIADFSDDETAADAVLTLGKSGGVTTETLKAFDFDAFHEVIASIEGACDDDRFSSTTVRDVHLRLVAYLFGRGAGDHFPEVAWQVGGA